MSYRTFLVHVDDTAASAQRVAAAAALALSFGGHLIGVAPTGVSRLLYTSLPSEQNDPTLALHLGFLREQSQAALAHFYTQCDTAGLTAREARTIDDEAGGGICLHGRGADLIVISQADPAEGRRALLGDLPAYVVLHAGRPVLLLPFAPGPGGAIAGTIGTRALVSWDASREAARALQLALPLLQKASHVRIAVFDTGADNHTLADARAADPVAYLARHGVTAQLEVHKTDGRRTDIGEALLSQASAMGADLLVMGGYGHSRVRETILGGVTRTVLETMTLPVLMAH